MDNKKGSAQLYIIGGLIVVALIILIIASISSKFRFILVGIILFAMLVFMFFKNEGKMNKSKIFIGLALLGISIFFMFGSGVLQESFPSGTYIQAPTFFYYECNAASEPVESTNVVLTTGSSDGWISCPSNTDQCDLYVYQTESVKWYSSDRRIVYQICHSSGRCDPQVFVEANKFLSRKGVPTQRIPNLIIGDKVWVDYQRQKLLGGWELQPNGAAWYQNYKPFILWKVDMFGGGKEEYTSISQGCNFPSSTSGLDSDYKNSGGILYPITKLINSVSDSSKQFNSQTTTSNTNVPFYKTRNFIGTYVPISSSNVNFVNYNNQVGYCLERQIFAITTVVTNGETYRIVDSNFNTRLAPSVTCCPGEKQTNQICEQQGNNFVWVTVEDAQCSAFKPCAGANWMPSGSKTLIRYNCVSGKCVSETKVVQCTSNSDCNTNYQCDTYTYTCVEVSPGTVCGDKKCDVGERKGEQNYCPADCDDDNNKCLWYQQSYTKETEDWGFLGWRHIINKPIVTVEEGCKTATWFYFAIAGITIAIIVIAGMIINKKPKKRK